MSAPTQLHESRVATLAALADLAGYTVDVRLDGRLQPDLTRLHRSAAKLLIADAKASEHPRGRATRSRLVGYAHQCDSWRHAGFEVSIAICHGLDFRAAWMQCLRDVASVAGANEWTEMLEQIDDAACVSVVRLPAITPRTTT